MPEYGQRTVATVGTSIRVSADGHPEDKHGGVTIDWTTVAPAVAASTLGDGVPIAIGDMYLRYGQVICRITADAVAVVTVDATSGTFTITLTTEVDGVAYTATTAAIAEAATIATVQAALRLLTTVPGAATVVVSGSTGGPFTLTFPDAAGLVVVTATSVDLAGGTGVTVATTSSGGNIDKYGPYDPAATDGRQSLIQGSTFVLNRTVKQTDILSNHPEAIDGGLVFLARIIQSGVASASLAAGPTLANLKTTFPRLKYVTEAPAAG
jgi:hypothetical protein